MKKNRLEHSTESPLSSKVLNVCDVLNLILLQKPPIKSPQIIVKSPVNPTPAPPVAPAPAAPVAIVPKVEPQGTVMASPDNSPPDLAGESQILTL